MRVGAVHPGTHLFLAAAVPSAFARTSSDSCDVQQKALCPGASLCTDSNGVRVLLGLVS